MIKSNFVHFTRKIDFALIGVILLFAYFSIKCIAVSQTSTLSFDGAMNVQVAQNLAENFRYATSYNGITDFDHRIQTGIPVILPAAIIIRLFGATSESVLVISAIYLILLAFFILLYLYKCVGIPGSFLIPQILLLYSTPNIFDIGLGLYGEIPAFFYILLFLIFLRRHEKSPTGKVLFWAGISLGLAILVKTVMLIFIPALIFAALFEILIKKRLLTREYLRQFALMALGCILPVALFEVIKVLSLGVVEYIGWWKYEGSGIFAQAGVTSYFPDTPELGEKLLIHLSKYASYTALHPIAIALVLLLLLAFFLAILYWGINQSCHKKVDTVGKQIIFGGDFLVMITVTLSYFGWWLMITPTEKAWLRRIINGTLLLEICVVIITFLLYRWLAAILKDKKITLNNILSIVFVLMLSILPAINIMQMESYLISFEPTPSKIYLRETGDYIQSLPESAEFFGYDWWQAPVVAFEAGRSFKDLNQNQEMGAVGFKSQKYFVIDQAVIDTGDPGYHEILGTFQNELVFSQNGYQIYQLIYRYPYAQFTDEDRVKVGYRSIDFTSEGDNYVTRNVYFDEDNDSGKWARRSSGYLLMYSGENTLKIVFSVYRIQTYDRFPFDLEIFINNELQNTYPIESEGTVEINVPLRQLPEGIIEVSLITNAKMKTPDGSRELSIFLQRMELTD